MPCGFRQEVSFKFSSRKSIFSLCDLNMHRTVRTILKGGGGDIRIIPAKFSSKSSQKFRRCPLKKLLTTHDSHPMTTITHLEPFGSGELKYEDLNAFKDICGYFQCAPFPRLQTGKVVWVLSFDP